MSLTNGEARRLERRERNFPQGADRLPPHSIESEQGILGCVLLDAKIGMPIAMERLKSADVFYDLRHEAIFSVAVEVFEKFGDIDMIVFSQTLKDRNQLEACGGVAYLASCMNAVPSAASIDYYLDIVLEKAVLRKMIQVCTGAVVKIQDHQGDDVAQMLDEVGKEVLAACESEKPSTIKPIKELIHHAINEIERSHESNGKPMGLSTGFPDLDKMTSGFHPGDLVVIAGRPGTGKTSIAMNIAEFVAVDCKEAVGIFSLEMSAESLALRMLCSRSRVNIRNIRDGFLAERDFPKMAGAAGKIANARLYIDDAVGITIMQLRAKARRMVQQFGVKLLVIDYLTKISCIGKFENRQQALTQIVEGIKMLAKELNIPTILIAQLNRDLEKDKNRKPRLSDLRETGALEQEADLVGLLYKPESENDDDESSSEAMPMNLFIAKQRNGPTGDVHLTFLKSITRFESASKIADTMKFERT